jgi:hypothetical protein
MRHHRQERHRHKSVSALIKGYVPPRNVVLLAGLPPSAQQLVYDMSMLLGVADQPDTKVARAWLAKAAHLPALNAP